MYLRFNTASGKYCCNIQEGFNNVRNGIVSIPQAVSTVATYNELCTTRKWVEVSIPQAVSTVATIKKGDYKNGN